MKFDEAMERADKVMGPIDDPCDCGTTDFGQRKFLRGRTFDEPDHVTIFVPVPGRTGEFTSRYVKRGRRCDDGIGAVEEV